MNKQPNLSGLSAFTRAHASGTGWRRWISPLVVLFAYYSSAALAASAGAPPHWVASWTASPQARWDGDFALPINTPASLWQQTVRQFAQISAGGRRVRIMLSNEYGTRPLHIADVRLALAAGQGDGIVDGSSHAITFDGQREVTIPPGAPMLSDPLDLAVAPRSQLAVSLFLPEPTAPSTFHWDARQTSFISAGDQTAAVAPHVDVRFTSRVFLRSILVEQTDAVPVVAAFGDSITDGAGSSLDRNQRWPDFLAQRLLAQHAAVINAGISGARVLRDKMGVNALARFDRDVLDQPGITSVIVLMGINDIGWNGSALGPHESIASAEALIAAYQQLIARAHLRGVRIIGATLTPFEGALDGTPMQGYYRLDKERVRQAVNRWIRTSKAFDAVADFDAVLRDPAHPQRFLLAYDAGDHLHPNDAGDKAMADALDATMLLGKP